MISRTVKEDAKETGNCEETGFRSLFFKGVRQARKEICAFLKKPLDSAGKTSIIRFDPIELDQMQIL